MRCSGLRCVLEHQKNAQKKIRKRKEAKTRSLENRNERGARWKRAQRESARCKDETGTRGDNKMERTGAAPWGRVGIGHGQCVILPPTCGSETTLPARSKLATLSGWILFSHPPPTHTHAKHSASQATRPHNKHLRTWTLQPAPGTQGPSPGRRPHSTPISRSSGCEVCFDDRRRGTLTAWTSSDQGRPLNPAPVHGGQHGASSRPLTLTSSIPTSNAKAQHTHSHTQGPDLAPSQYPFGF